MSVSAVSTAYLGTALIPSITQVQSQLTELEIESTTGEYANLGLQLGAQSGYEVSLRNQNDLMQTLTAANNITVTNLSAAQSAIGALVATANTTAQDLTTWTSGANSGATLQTLGQSGLQQLISAANTSSGDQFVFGGINGSTAPLANYYSTPASAAKTAIDAVFQAAFGVGPSDPSTAAISSSALQGFLSGPFANLFSGANWTRDWSSASSVNTTGEIEPGQTVETSTNANTPGFQQLAEGYAMLSEFGGSPLNSSASQTLASQALSLINAGASALTATSASLGATQSEVTQANTAMSSQMTILQTQIGNLDNVDAAAVATQLNSLQTQIETAYQLTAQLQKLSLAQYLPS